MKLLAVVLFPLALLSGCTFGTDALPDGFELRAVGTYRYMPIPYAEGGMYYDFIGIGWLVHDERVDDIHLAHRGQEIAVDPRGGLGWKLAPAGMDRVKRDHWSQSSGKEGWALSTQEHYPAILVGCSPRIDLPPDWKPPPPPKRLVFPSMLNGDDEMRYLHRQRPPAVPLRILDDQWDTAIFLFDEIAYTRVLGFASSHYEFVESAVPFSEDYPDKGIKVLFSLRDRRTGAILSGSYRHRSPKAETVSITGISSRGEPLLTGQPCWVPLGVIGHYTRTDTSTGTSTDETLTTCEVYQERDYQDAEKELFLFDASPRWFHAVWRPASKAEFEAWKATMQTHGKFQLEQSDHFSVPVDIPIPKALGDLPTESQAVRLKFDVLPSKNPARLRFDLAMASPARKVLRELEHRRTNILPLLFAVYVDGKALSFPDQGAGAMGGANSWRELVPKGDQRLWSLDVDAASLQRLLPDKKPHDVALVAAFSEVQHEPVCFLRYPTQSIVKYSEDPAAFPLLLRSNVAEIRWTGEKWESPAIGNQVRP